MDERGEKVRVQLCGMARYLLNTIQIYMVKIDISVKLQFLNSPFMAAAPEDIGGEKVL